MPSKPLGPATPARFAAPLAATMLVLGATVPGHGADAGLQQALRQAGCAAPTTKQVLSQQDVAVFEANCFGTSHRVLTVTCVRDACRVDEARRKDEGR